MTRSLPFCLRAPHVTRLAVILAAAVSAVPTAFGEDEPRIIRYSTAGLAEPSAQKSSREGSKTTTYHYYKSSLNSRVASGVWEADGFHSPLRKAPSTEYIHVIAGTITLADGTGQEHVFRAGDDLVIPRGSDVEWKKTENVKEYWAIFDLGSATDSLSSTTPKIIRLSANGPAGEGLIDRGQTKSHKYLGLADGSSVGVWETQPSTAPNFHKTKYAELMVFLSGTVTLSTLSKTEVFHAGDIALVPRGIEYKWSSDTAKKFYAIFDSEPKPAQSAAK